jgi:Resolvase, N terminal domain
VRRDGDTTPTEPPSGTRIGYTRVSTVAQTLDQQNAALTAAGVSKTFSDVMSGARDDRPGLAALFEYVREGDTVVVWKLDRLGRNTLHILETVKALTDRGVTLVSVTDGIDSSTAAGRMMIGVLGSLAEYEREFHPCGYHDPRCHAGSCSSRPAPRWRCPFPGRRSSARWAPPLQP